MKSLSGILRFSVAITLMALASQALAIPEGTYQISAMHSGKCMDVSKVSQDNGAKVHQWSCVGGDNQKWRVTRAGDNAYQLQAVHSGKCLDVRDVSYERGAMMQQWSCTGTANQQFLINSTGDGAYRLRARHSGLTIEVGASSYANGANVKQWSWWGGDSQRWHLDRVNVSTDNSAGSGSTTNSGQTLDDGTYLIEAKHSGKCLDVSGYSQSNGARVHQWRCHGGDNQQWRVKHASTGYSMQAVHSGKCLDVKDISLDKGAPLQQWSCGHGLNQRFDLKPLGDGSYRMRPMHSGLTVEIGASSTENDANVKQWTWWGGDSQRFLFRAANGDSNPSTTNPRAVWTQNFDNTQGQTWFYHRYLEVRGGCGTNGSRCLRATYNPSSEGSPRIVRRVRIPASKEYTLNYDVMFEQGYDFVHGGKLPGLGPDSVTAGCIPTVPEGWSARVMWRDNGTPVIYSYDQERANRCGEDYYSSIQFDTGRYYAVSLHVKVNDPFWQANGLIELYVDGRKVAEQQNVHLRNTNGQGTQITQVLFDTFFGGSSWYWAPPRTVHSRFDNFAVYPGLRVRSALGQ